MTNLTSAGQFAGLSVMLTGGAFIELAITTLVINLRYLLMSIALSQKLESSMPLYKKCLVAFGNTDEIFAIAVNKGYKLKASYMAGLITMPYIGWALGTIIGATATTFLPESLQTAMGIMIYGMFIAIIIPPAKKAKPVFYTVLSAVVVRCLFYYIPGLKELSSGWAVIITAVICAGLVSLRFPVARKEDNDGL